MLLVAVSAQHRKAHGSSIPHILKYSLNIYQLFWSLTGRAGSPKTKRLDIYNKNKLAPV